VKQISGYVATLDVLGFSDMLQRDGYEQELRNYITCINDVIRPASVNTECVVFSDSIVLTSPGTDEDAFRNVVHAGSAAFSALLKNRIPVRGAVAFGKYWREAQKKNVFLAGRPIVEAYRCEQSSNWVGILLCPSVLHQRPGLAGLPWLPEPDEVAEELDGLGVAQIDEIFDSLSLRVQQATIPFLDSDSRSLAELSGYALVPMGLDDNLATANRTVNQAWSALEDLRLKAPQPRAQAKYQVSLKWLAEIRKRLRPLSNVYRKAKKNEQQRAS
jgi:hypothetical protein